MPSAPRAPVPDGPAVKIGDVVLDRYRVIEQIGTGGHSVVFKGNDERLSRPVCVKVFSGLGGGSGVGRTSYEHFVQEAFALSRLTHPNTLRIYDFGHLGAADAPGMPVQVCEFMNGGTLSQIIREQGPQSLAEMLQIIPAMCAALAEAHALGIVHRDIKPQNILFGSVGTTRSPKLADFGIAKWSETSDESGATRDQRAEDTAIVAGQKLAMYSPSWAAPEQLAGQPVSPATDIYSLAIVAVYVISAKAIFADEDVYAGYKRRRYADQHVRDALADLDLPKGVITALSRALAFDPKQRTARIDELSAELQSASEQSAFPDVQTPTTLVHPSTPALPLPAVPRTRTAPGHAVSPIPTAPLRRIEPAEAPQPVSDRRVQFVMAGNGVADLVGVHGTKLRASLLPGAGGERTVHVKGMNCFVCPSGGRPSGAVTVHQSSDIALVTPRAQEIGHVRVVQGTLEGMQTTFTVGSEQVTIGSEDCADPILFDFGPGADAYFVYTRGRTVPRSGRRG